MSRALDGARQDRYSGAIPTTHRTLDDIDLAIIHELVESPRRGYSDLAESVGLSARAAKARVRELRESRCVRIAGRVDPTILGYGLFAFAFIEAGGSALELAQSLGRQNETAFIVAVGGSADLIVDFRCRDWGHLVATAFGAFDVVAEVGYRDPGHLVETLDSLRSIPGVKRLESFPYLLEVKESMEAGLWQSQ